MFKIIYFLTFFFFFGWKAFGTFPDQGFNLGNGSGNLEFQPLGYQGIPNVIYLTLHTGITAIFLKVNRGAWWATAHRVEKSRTEVTWHVGIDNTYIIFYIVYNSHEKIYARMFMVALFVRASNWKQPQRPS